MTIMTAADATATPNGVGHGEKAASAGNRDDAAAVASPLSTSIHQRIPVDLPIPLAEAGGSSHHLHHHHQHHPSATVDNPLPHVLPEGENATPLEVMGSTASDKLVIIMVGLPATGKTHIAKRICRFLSFFHDIPSQIFNVGDYRRQLSGAQQPAEFYSASNPDGVAARTVACDAALSDLCDYVSQDGVRVAAFDATNTSFERRQHIIRVLKERGRGIKKMFVESMCDDEAVSTNNNSYCSCTRAALRCVVLSCLVLCFVVGAVVPTRSSIIAHLISLIVATLTSYFLPPPTSDPHGEHPKGQAQHAGLQGHGPRTGGAGLYGTTRELQQGV